MKRNPKVTGGCNPIGYTPKVVPKADRRARRPTERAGEASLPLDQRMKILRRSNMMRSQEKRVRRAMKFVVDGKSMEGAIRASGLVATRNRLSRVIALATGIAWSHGGSVRLDSTPHRDRRGRSRLSGAERVALGKAVEEFWGRWGDE